MASTVLSTIEPYLLGAVSQSTGSILVDGIIGGVAAYSLAPPNMKARAAAGGALATGLAGVLGLAGTVAFILATEHDNKMRKKRRRTR